MVCIYCGAKTQVTNSRAQKKLGQTWRRRQCLKCKAIFTTIEAADLSDSFMVNDDNRGNVVSFNRDKLLLSIVHALGHRTDSVEAATALTATTISFLLKTAQTGRIERKMIIETVLSVITRFDTVAAVQYRAYHPL